MIEDTEFRELCVAPMNQDNIFSCEDGEKAYALKTVNLGTCIDDKSEKEKLAAAVVSADTLGFEFDFEVDMYPYVLDTYTADKQHNAHFEWGEHAPDGQKYQESCRFRPGDKVLCVVHQGYDAVVPAIVVRPMSIEDWREWFESDEFNPFDNFEEYLEQIIDWDWDSVIVRPLVRLDRGFEKMEEIIAIPRVYIFPYQKFEI